MDSPSGAPYIVVVVVVLERKIAKFYGFINNSFHRTMNDGLSCFQGDDLVIGNVGDSRAILARRTDEDEMEAIQLTVDLKPNLPSTI
jgi:serine/threonine protein phosphatase PrpC